MLGQPPGKKSRFGLLYLAELHLPPGKPPKPPGKKGLTWWLFLAEFPSIYSYFLFLDQERTGNKGKLASEIVRQL